MTCQHCGKDLYEALRKGCHEKPCKPLSRDFDKPLEDPYDFPKDDEKKSVPLSERFNVVFTGFDWYVVDRMGSWYVSDNKKAAYDKAAFWNYEWDAICGGKV